MSKTNLNSTLTEWREFISVTFGTVIHFENLANVAAIKFVVDFAVIYSCLLEQFDLVQEKKQLRFFSITEAFQQRKYLFGFRNCSDFLSVLLLGFPVWMKLSGNCENVTDEEYVGHS